MTAPTLRSPARAPWASWLFTLSVFVSAALLFLVQPMVGKMILPKFGGSPAVWNTCMVFFQGALLAGYAYAHASTAWLGVRRQTAVHLGLLLLPLLVLPIWIAEDWRPQPDAPPVLPLLGLLLVSAGLPFFVVSTSGPLLQRWYAEAGGSGDPYFLYAASNAGSMLALLAYPALVEPLVPLRQQAWLWAVGYGLLVCLTGTAALLVRRALDPSPEGLEAAGAEAHLGGRVGVWERARWVVLALVPSSLLLGVTTHITTDIAPIPLLWVVPLALYLLSFVLAFSRLPVAFHRCLAALFVPAVLGLVLWVSPSEGIQVKGLSLGQLVLAHLLVFFIAATVCHSELARQRPPVARLTEFYLWVSVGGVLGGLFNALLAPALFTSIVEYRVGLVLAALLLPPLFPARPPFRWLNRGLPVLLAAAVAVALVWKAPSRGRVLEQTRTFFGVLRVESGTAGRTHSFVHDNCRHGLQLRSEDPRQRRLPLLYYYPTGPIGQVFTGLQAQGIRPKVGVVGLGIGTLASYGEPGQSFTFFEIDPAVERIARDPRLFTYLQDAEERGVQVRTVLGDARLSLQREGEGGYDLLVVDAFSGDAIPTHLLTREALELYLKRLKGNGLLAFHITNEYADLRPVLAAQARELGLVGLLQDDNASEEEARRGKAPSRWVVLAPREAALRPLLRSGRWGFLPDRPDFQSWTDDYSNVLGVLHR